MIRSKRFNKSFVSGGLYDPNNTIEQYQNQQTQKTFQRIDTSVGKIMKTEKDTAKMKVESEQNVSLATHQNSNNANQLNLNNSDVVDENGKVKFRKIFGIRKKASVRAKEKRVRQNRRLRRTIIPKNALMALHEVKGLLISDFDVNSNPSGGFTAKVHVNDTLYEGYGNSKTAAKNHASEKALRDYVITKMRQNPRKISGSVNNSGREEVMDGVEERNELTDDKDDTEDIPMVNLASFALYKLFSEWEREGFIVPEMHPTRGNISDNESDIVLKEPKKAPKRNELPSNWNSMHPASLLCVMRPGITYIDEGRTGVKTNEIQTMSVVVDDHKFVAKGRSKKMARHNVAVIACNDLFNTNFEEMELSCT